MDILDYLLIWRRRWKIVVAATLLGVGIAAAVSALTQPEYVASTRLFVTTTGGASVVEAYQGNLFGQERVQSYSHLVTGKQVAQRTIDQLQINLTPEQLQSMTNAEVVPNSVLMDISVTNPNPTLAADLANAVAIQTSQLVEELETSARGGSPAASATLVDEAEVPATPATPMWIPNLLLGLAGGLLVGLTAAIARDKLDRSVRSLDDAAQAAGAPPMGDVPDKRRHRAEGIPFGREHPETSEAFRSVRTNLLAESDSDATGAVIVATPRPSGASTTVTLGLAGALAESGWSVLAVDGNLRDKGISAALDLVDRPGLSDVLNRSAQLHEAIVPTDITNMAVLPGGTKSAEASSLLSGARMTEVLKTLCGDYDYVLIDGAPVLTYADSLTIAEWVDGLLLVANAGRTIDRDLTEAAKKARMARGQVLGVVITNSRPN